MSMVVMIVVLLAALLHALWNFFVKSTDDKHLSMSADGGIAKAIQLVAGRMHWLLFYFLHFPALSRCLIYWEERCCIWVINGFS